MTRNLNPESNRIEAASCITTKRVGHLITSIDLSVADTAQRWAKLSVLLFADTSNEVCRYAEGCSICSKKLSYTYNLMAIPIL